MTALPPTWTIEELRAMTPEERRVWQVERATAWAKVAIDAAGDPTASLTCALACLADATRVMRAVEAIRREERPVPPHRFGPIGPVTVLERGSLVLTREKP